MKNMQEKNIISSKKTTDKQAKKNLKQQKLSDALRKNLFRRKEVKNGC